MTTTKEDLERRERASWRLQKENPLWRDTWLVTPEEEEVWEGFRQRARKAWDETSPEEKSRLLAALERDAAGEDG